MLEYMTEECYEKQWGDIYSNENGYLCYDNIGETGIQYKVNSIEKTTDGYKASVTASSEGPDIKKHISILKKLKEKQKLKKLLLRKTNIKKNTNILYSKTVDKILKIFCSTVFFF